MITLFPEYCPSCHGAVERGFCGGCRADFETVDVPCPRCGLPRPVTTCPLRDAEWPLDRVIAPYRYGAPLDHYVLALKLGGRRKLGRSLGLLLADALPPLPRVDALVPVPLHRDRMRERGYNQSHEIARPIARQLCVPLVSRGVRRARATLPQTGLDAERRFGNVARVFEISRPLHGLRIALVDDVMTTGATVTALARACRAAGARAVDAWAVARTVPGEDR